MVSQLPKWVEDAALAREVSIACLESYFINYRLLVEFLVRSPKKKDFSRRDFLREWDPAPSSDVDRVNDDWEFASQNVVHLSKKRLPGEQEVYQSVDPRVLAAMAYRLSMIFRRFVDKCQDERVAQSTMFRLALEQAQAELEALV
jgi:hypothetical protein